MEPEKKNDMPPPPFKMEELDYGTSWAVLAVLLILTGFALIGLAVFFMLS